MSATAFSTHCVVHVRSGLEVAVAQAAAAQVAAQAVAVAQAAVAVVTQGGLQLASMRRRRAMARRHWPPLSQAKMADE